MNHLFRSLLLVAMLAFGGLTQTDAFAQQTPPAPPEPAAAPETPPGVEVEVESTQDDADDAQRAAERAKRKAERESEWQGRNRENVVLNIGDDSKLPSGETAAAVISIFGNAEAAGDVYETVAAIGGNARTTGSVGEGVVAVLGNAYVDGKVGEAVVAVMGDVELGPNARVTGDVVSMGGKIIRDPGSTLTGTQQQIAFGDHLGKLEGLRTWFKECLLYGRPLAFDADVQWAWWLAFGFLALYVVIALLFDSAVRRCVETLETRPAQTVLAAILSVLLSPVMIVLLAITIIGIMLIPFFGLGLFCMGLFGKAVVLGALGRRITRFTGIAPLGHVAFAVFIGGLIAMLIYTVPALGFITYNVLSFLGLGAVAYTLILAVRPTNGTPAPAVAPAAAAPATFPAASMEDGTIPPEAPLSPPPPPFFP